MSFMCLSSCSAQDVTCPDIKHPKSPRLQHKRAKFNPSHARTHTHRPIEGASLCIISEVIRMPNRATRCTGKPGRQGEAQPSRAGGTTMMPTPTCLKPARSSVAPCTGRAPRSGARPAADPPAPGRRAPTEGQLSVRHAPHTKSPLRLPAGTAQGQGAVGEPESCPGRARSAPAAPSAASGEAPLPPHTPGDARGPRHPPAACARPPTPPTPAAGGGGSGSAQSGVGPAGAAAPQAHG